MVHDRGDAAAHVPLQPLIARSVGRRIELARAGLERVERSGLADALAGLLNARPVALLSSSLAATSPSRPVRSRSSVNASMPQRVW